MANYNNTLYQINNKTKTIKMSLSTLRFGNQQDFHRFTADDAGNAQKQRKTPVLILDRSGSMGSASPQCVTLWRNYLYSVGYTSDSPVHILAFNRGCLNVRGKLNDIRPENFYATDGTYMSTVINPLIDILRKNTNFAIWIISDGELHDSTAFKEIFDLHMVPYLGQFSISVCAIRLQTGGTPETSALCRFGSLSAAGAQLNTTNIYDLHNHLGKIDTNATYFILRSPTPIFMRNPSDAPQTEIVIYDGDSFVTVNGADTTTIQCQRNDGNAIVVRLRQMTPVEAATHLENWAKALCAKFAQIKIINGNVDAQIDALDALLKNFEEYAATLETETSDSTTADRIKQIKRTLAKNNRGVRTMLAELRNTRNLSALSAQQQADYLRTLNVSSKSDKGLMRRYANSGGGDSVEDKIANAVEKLKAILEQLKNIPENDEAQTCFVCMENSIESAISAIEGVIEITDNYCAIDVDNALRLFGLIGVAINHHVGNFTDPMNFYGAIKEIYYGVYLNQSSLWNSLKVDRTLYAWGTRGKITGVIPLQHLNHPLVWKAYVTMTEIAALQNSAQMRHIVTPLPLDSHALTCSAILHMLEAQLHAGNDIQQNTFKWLCDTMTYFFQSQRISDDIAQLRAASETDANAVGVFMTSENGFASLMYPYALIFARQEMQNLLDNSAFLQELHSYEIYWRVRKTISDDDNDNRAALVEACLGITDADETHVLPDDEDEPETPVFCNDVNISAILEKMPTTSLFTLVTNLFGKSRGPIDSDPVNAAEYVKALMCKDESQRVDKANSTMRHPFFTSANSATQWLCNLVRDIYRKRYEVELAAKKQRLYEQALKNFIVAIPSLKFGQFYDQLCALMPNQTHEALILVVSAVKTVDCIDQAMKAEVLLLGQLGDKIWNNSNILRSYIVELEPLISDERREYVTEEIGKQIMFHKYRNGKNRHGHSNENPSYYALTGYSHREHHLKKDFADAMRILNVIRSCQNSLKDEHKLIWDKFHYLLDEATAEVAQ